ncbi:hypothetical protein ACS0TY_008866 [Phlomoides rotata]
MFLSILVHHKKNRVIKFDFRMSGQTVSHYVHIVLRVVLSLHTLFLVKPTPVTDDSTDSRWKWFKAFSTSSTVSDSFFLKIVVCSLDLGGIGHFCPNCSPVMSENSLGPSSALVELSLQLNLSHSYKLSEA